MKNPPQPEPVSKRGGKPISSDFFGSLINMLFGGLRDDTRGTSTQVAFVISLTIAALLTGSVISGVGSFVDNQSQAAVNTELRMIGEQLASELETADTIARNNPDTSFRHQLDLPEGVIGGGYTIVVHTGPNPEDDYLRLKSASYRTAVIIPMNIETNVKDNSIESGDLVIIRSGGTIELVEVDT